MKPETFLKQFYYTRFKELPIEQDGEFLGILSKSEVQSYLSDLEDSSEIPLNSNLLKLTVQESTLHLFQKETKIPVLNEIGDRIGEWDKSTLILKIEKTKEISIPKQLETNPEGTKPESIKDIPWFMQKLLENLPNGLYATDREGKLLFYNEVFENEILTRKFLRNSFVYAEKYFRELTREILSRALESNPELLEKSSYPRLKTSIDQEKIMVTIMPIKHGKDILGHLFEFVEQPQDSKSSTLKSLIEECFKKKMTRDQIQMEVHQILDQLFPENLKSKLIATAKLTSTSKIVSKKPQKKMNQTKSSAKKKKRKT